MPYWPINKLNMPLNTIFHLESSMGWGGQEMRIYNETSWLIEHGHHVVLVAPKESTIYKKFNAANWDVIDCSFKKSKLLLELFQLIHIFKKHSAIAVNTHSNIDSKLGLVAAKLAGVPAIIRSRHISNPIRSTWYNKFLYNFFATNISTTGDCISQEIIQKLNSPKDKVQTIATGIRFPNNPTSKSNNSLKEQLKLDHHHILIGMVSVLRSWKGHPFLFEALKNLISKNNKIHLIIAGDGPQKENLHLLVKELNIESHVHFLGHVTDVFSVFENLDLALLTSTKNEGIPQSLMQAMACKCPVIGTDIGGIPELLCHGDFGTIIEAENPKQIEDAVLDVINNKTKYNDIAEKSFLHVKENYHIDVMGHKMLKIFGLEK